jgi:hypothetical protein
MRTKGLEPSHLAVLEPKSSASTNSAMSAGINLKYYSILEPERKPPTKSRDRPDALVFLAPPPALGLNPLETEKAFAALLLRFFERVWGQRLVAALGLEEGHY